MSAFFLSNNELYERSMFWSNFMSKFSKEDNSKDLKFSEIPSSCSEDDHETDNESDYNFEMPSSSNNALMVFENEKDIDNDKTMPEMFFEIMPFVNQRREEWEKLGMTKALETFDAEKIHRTFLKNYHHLKKYDINRFETHKTLKNTNNNFNFKLNLESEYSSDESFESIDTVRYIKSTRKSCKTIFSSNAFRLNRIKKQYQSSSQYQYQKLFENFLRFIRATNAMKNLDINSTESMNNYMRKKDYFSLHQDRKTILKKKKYKKSKSCDYFSSDSCSDDNGFERIDNKCFLKRKGKEYNNLKEILPSNFKRSNNSEIIANTKSNEMPVKLNKKCPQCISDKSLNSCNIEESKKVEIKKSLESDKMPFQDVITISSDDDSCDSKHNKIINSKNKENDLENSKPFNEDVLPQISGSYQGEIFINKKSMQQISNDDSKQITKIQLTTKKNCNENECLKRNNATNDKEPITKFNKKSNKNDLKEILKNKKCSTMKKYELNIISDDNEIKKQSIKTLESLPVESNANKKINEKKIQNDKKKIIKNNKNIESISSNNNFETIQEKNKCASNVAASKNNKSKAVIIQNRESNKKNNKNGNYVKEVSNDKLIDVNSGDSGTELSFKEKKEEELMAIGKSSIKQTKIDNSDHPFINKRRRGRKVILHSPKDNIDSDQIFYLTDEHIIKAIGSKVAEKFLKYNRNSIRRKFKVSSTIYFKYGSDMDSNPETSASEEDILEKFNKYGTVQESPK